jgi:hypothetical protein
MASTYSSNLKLQLMGTGDNAGTWGAVTNLNLGTALEEAVAGTIDVAFSSADVTLTLTDANTAQPARNMRLNLTGTSGGARSLIVPAIEKMYVVNSGLADACTVKVSGQTGVAVPAGKTTLLFNNGTDVVNAITHLASLTLATDLAVTGTATAAGLTVASDSTYAIDVSRPSAGNTTLRITGGSTAGNDAVLRADIANTTGTSAVYFGDTDTNGIGRIMYEHNGDYMRFYTSSTEKMRIDGSGNVGIGTTNPAATVDVSGNARGAVTTDNDLSFDLSASNNFSCTPTGGGTLTFTNHLAGQSGFIWLDNSGGHAIAAAGTTKINAADLTAISTAGVYTLSYFDNGTNAYVSVSRSFA